MRLPVNEAVHIGLEIAQALVHAFERGVVHRDIKPSNIIITRSGRAKLVDMGLARRFERGGGDDGLTQSGMTLGTFDYISPEQARDPRDVDVRSDLYSLGCTMFQMLTGRPPFPGRDGPSKVDSAPGRSSGRCADAQSASSADLASTIARLMAKDRDRRYQTPEHLVRDLLGVAGSIGLSMPSASFPAWHTESPRHDWAHHLVWLVPVVALLAAVSALAWWGPDRQPAPIRLGASERPGRPAPPRRACGCFRVARSAAVR